MDISFSKLIFTKYSSIKSKNSSTFYYSKLNGLRKHITFICSCGAISTFNNLTAPPSGEQLDLIGISMNQNLW
jgi:hypothetical protein